MSKKDQIIDKAIELFGNKGFDNTTIRELSHEAGINIAMINYYFGSKEKLLETLFAYRSESSVMKVEKLLQDKSSTHIQKVNYLIDYYIDKFQNESCFHKIMSREQVQSHRNSVTELSRSLKKETRNWLNN
jgi:AcrR family transcriptional regulator